MYKIEINPRFKDTDALGHINNASFITWIEEARKPVFKEFNPNLSIEKWNLIIARVEMDFVAQCYYGKKVVINSSIEKIGTSSLTIYHDLFQEEAKIAQGKSVLVHFDYSKNKSVPIPEEVKQSLKKHLKNL